QCRAYENDTAATVDDMPPHSIRVVVWDGTEEDADDDAIAQSNQDSKPAGITTVGDESGTAVDVNGDTKTLSFDRATQVQLYVATTLQSALGYDADDVKL